MCALAFRNISATPEDPIEQWGVEGILAAIDRGSLQHWRKIRRAVVQEPYGPVAADLGEALSIAEDRGARAALSRVLVEARAGEQNAARVEVARRLRELVEASGLSDRAFAMRLGTSPSRMSTYLSGGVTPSAALLPRAEWLAERCRNRKTEPPTHGS